MPQVIRNTGDPNHARTLNGKPVQREKELWLPTYQSYIPVLQTSMHFCYRDPSVPRGTTLFCTCGAIAVVVGYEAYRHLQSYMGNEVIVCLNYIQYKTHSDGSHE
jgi:hypothetical protein